MYKNGKIPQAKTKYTTTYTKSLQNKVKYATIFHSKAFFPSGTKTCNFWFENVCTTRQPLPKENNRSRGKKIRPIWSPWTRSPFQKFKVASDKR
jgi:hypothetical protein